MKKKISLLVAIGLVLGLVGFNVSANNQDNMTISIDDTTVNEGQYFDLKLRVDGGEEAGFTGFDFKLIIDDSNVATFDREPNDVDDDWSIDLEEGDAWPDNDDFMYVDVANPKEEDKVHIAGGASHPVEEDGVFLKVPMVAHNEGEVEVSFEDAKGDGEDEQDIADFEDGTVTVRESDNGAPPPPPPENGDDDEEEIEGTSRLSGNTRHETATSISQESYSEDNSADSVVLARAFDFPDALAGVPLAYDRNGPLLLTDSDSLSSGTRAEINRVMDDGGTVYILGGEVAISGDVKDELEADYNVERLSGADRYETAAEIARELTDNPDEVFLSTGENFADAVAVSGVAASRGSPVILTPSDSLADSAESYLSDHEGTIEDIIAVGGEVAISDSVYEAANATQRLAGDDRYHTAVEIAREFYPSPSDATLATGEDFPDALSGGVFAALTDAPVLLTRSNSAPDSVADYFNEVAVDDIFVFGGSNAVSNDVLRELR